MRYLMLMCVLAISLTACATYSTDPPRPNLSWQAPEGANRQKDEVECRAIAAQAAMGAGGWTSVAPVAAAFYDEAKRQYYVQCVESRGYRWVGR